MMKDRLSENLSVHMFSGFSMCGLGGTLGEELFCSEMLTKLLVYFICHRENEITSQEMMDIFWNEAESDNPAGALKNLICRLRLVLRRQWPGIEFIQTGHGFYRWNPGLSMTVDAEEFEELYKKNSERKEASEKIRFLKKGIELYRGNFLPKLSGEYWILSQSIYYHSRYLSMVREVSQLLEREGRYAEMEQIASRALHLDALEESLYCCLIRALLGQNQNALARLQYEKAEELLLEHLGVSPSRELRMLYAETFSPARKKVQNLAFICRELDASAGHGALWCEYASFRKAYQLGKDHVRRLGGMLVVSLITVSWGEICGKPSSICTHPFSQSMEQLKQILNRMLRTGDVVSRYSEAQYILLLFACGREKADDILERVEAAFTKEQEQICMKYTLEEITGM